MNGKLQGKIAIITGGASGLGAAGVELFVREGATVLVADIREPTLDYAKAYGDKAIFFQCDVTNEAQVQALIAKAVGDLGGLDILYNNAGGGGPPGNVTDIVEAAWDSDMAVMLKSVMLMTKAAVPALARRGGGSVINTASIAGIRPGIAGLSYSVAKAGVSHFTRMIVPELGRQNIRVNTICPGIIPTPAIGGAFALDYPTTLKVMPEIGKIYSQAVPLQDVGVPEDIAKLALFLACDDSRFITGQEIAVDGGLSQAGPGSMDLSIPGNVVENIIAFITAFKADQEVAP
jgi:NAD(P)-dependent dehydrogenase (short-subunit alcohol dehydrogenase family)